MPEESLEERAMEYVLKTAESAGIQDATPKTVYAAPETVEEIYDAGAMDEESPVAIGWPGYSTVADVAAHDSVEPGALYADSDTRHSLRGGVNAVVALDPVAIDEVPVADEITVALDEGGPLDDRDKGAAGDGVLASQEAVDAYQEAVQDYLASHLLGRFVTDTDRYIYPSGQDIPEQSFMAAFDVDALTPDGEHEAVRVGPETRIRLEWEPDASGAVDTRDAITYDRVGGLDDVIDRVKEVVQYPIEDPEAYRAGDRAGVILYGPPGTGKTLLAEAVANEVDATFLQANGAELYKRFFSESESSIREFMETAEAEAPSVVFIDEMESLVPDPQQVGGSAGDAIRRAVSQWETELDGIKKRDDVYIIGATNYPGDIDPAIRRNQRIDKEIEVGVPDREGRREILDIHTDYLPVADDVDLDAIAAQAQGYVGADIKQLVVEAETHLNRRARALVDDPDTAYSSVSDARDGEGMAFTREDFSWALEEVDPQLDAASTGRDRNYA